MNENYIKKLIKLVEDSEIESLEVSSWGKKVKIIHRLNSQNANGSGQVVHYAQPAAAPAPQPAPVAAPQAAAPQADTAESSSDNLVPITSPMVGTYYEAPSPDADPYVSLNQKVNVGQVVCIVEAMKLMNEIESEVSGRIAKVMVENAQPVEYGQTLFLIDPNG
ncbi:MAG: acetyl-CoA carboxylase biotin carboxyl carrier protein [Calditrichaeota bacterium]|nr:MAG: acetyl-CoA carboxylase biotin carboxyl carrier protein [Calditrichota bacterium]